MRNLAHVIKRIYVILIMSGSASLVLLITFLVREQATPKLLRVDFLDIGQGDAIHIRLPDDTSLLVDGGIDNDVLYELGAMLPWWQRHLNYVMITHPDLDHYGGIAGVVEKYVIEQLFYNGDEKDDAYFRYLISAIGQQQIPVSVISQGFTLHWSSGVTLRILWPRSSYHTSDTNARSLVALLSWNEIDILLTGDLPQEEELELLRDYPDLSADVLKVGHHGSKHSSGLIFLEALSPQYCIISAGIDNSYGHPHQDVLDNLNAVRCTTLQTAELGTISIRSDGYELWIEK